MTTETEVLDKLKSLDWGGTAAVAKALGVQTEFVARGGTKRFFRKATMAEKLAGKLAGGKLTPDQLTAAITAAQANPEPGTGPASGEPEPIGAMPEPEPVPAPEVKPETPAEKTADPKSPDADLMSALRKLIQETAPKAGTSSSVIEVKIPGRDTVKLEEHTRPELPEIIMDLTAGLPVLLAGPAGCGKTHLAEQVSRAMSSRFIPQSYSAGTAEYHLLGRKEPTGPEGQMTFNIGPYADAYMNGGLYLADEIFNVDPNVMNVLNASLANGHLSLPGHSIPVPRHKDFHFIGADNTLGDGPDRMYVGRNQQDAALLNRFSASTYVLDYDAVLETAIIPAKILKWGLSVRAVIVRDRLRRIMGTRDMLNASKAISAGRTLDSVKRSYFSRWTKDEMDKLPASARPAPVAAPAPEGTVSK